MTEEVWINKGYWWTYAPQHRLDEGQYIRADIANQRAERLYEAATVGSPPYKHRKQLEEIIDSYFKGLSRSDAETLLQKLADEVNYRMEVK